MHAPFSNAHSGIHPGLGVLIFICAVSNCLFRASVNKALVSLWCSKVVLKKCHRVSAQYWFSTISTMHWPVPKSGNFAEFLPFVMVVSYIDSHILESITVPHVCCTFPDRPHDLVAYVKILSSWRRLAVSVEGKLKPPRSIFAPWTWIDIENVKSFILLLLLFQVALLVQLLDIKNHVLPLSCSIGKHTWLSQSQQSVEYVRDLGRHSWWWYPFQNGKLSIGRMDRCIEEPFVLRLRAGSGLRNVLFRLGSLILTFPAARFIGMSEINISCRFVWFVPVCVPYDPVEEDVVCDRSSVISDDQVFGILTSLPFKGPPTPILSGWSWEVWQEMINKFIKFFNAESYQVSLTMTPWPIHHEIAVRLRPN